MLEIYDRVLPSRSLPTLIGLAIVTLVLFGFAAILDLIRSRMFTRIGAWLGQSASDNVFHALAALPLNRSAEGDPLQPVRDLDQIRAFLAGGGPAAFFDLPWIPLYLGVCFYFHALIGTAALVGSVVLLSLTLMTEVWTKGPTRMAISDGVLRNAVASAASRNAEVVRSMGMEARLRQRWSAINDRFIGVQLATADVVASLGAVSRTLRIILQSTVLGIGAYLVIIGEATAGVVFASSMLVSRAMAPVDLAISRWQSFAAARQSWVRLEALLKRFPDQVRGLELPPPSHDLAVENIHVAPPGSERSVVQGVSFLVRAGSAVGVVGPSGSGKSTLVRTIVGAWASRAGKVRIDGAALEQWASEDLGRHIGYLPQDVDLFAGTVAENISRFDARCASRDIIAAAQAAGVHELILKLPDGYESQIGEGGVALSAGQRQRIALARALFRDPFLVVLDEPNSNLDHAGDQALQRAILGVRARGGIAVIVAHRPSALENVDLMLAVAEGKAVAFGPKDEVTAKVTRSAVRTVSKELRTVADNRNTP
ncbi:PrtD family type I secretion system ABC transporter [Bradyrhizobium sp. USDA 4502]